MEDDSRLKLKFIIMDFSVWDAIIHQSVMLFHEKYNVYPNILLGSDSSYRKIDLYAQKHPERLIDPKNNETMETSTEPFNGLSHFAAEDYVLEICLDYDLTEGNFILVFDEAPDFSGEPEPEMEFGEKQSIYQFRKIA